MKTQAISPSNTLRPDKQINTLHAASTVAFTLMIAIIIVKWFGQMFVPFRDLTVALTATATYSIAIFGYRLMSKKAQTFECHIFQIVVAATVGLCEYESTTIDYRLVVLGTFLVLTFHNICIDGILYRIRRIDDRLYANRKIVCGVLGVFASGVYAYSVNYLPKELPINMKRLIPESSNVFASRSMPSGSSSNSSVMTGLSMTTGEQVTSLVPRAISLLSLSNEEKEKLFGGIFENTPNARKYEQLNKLAFNDVCGYPREWIEQLKEFENDPLHKGVIKVSHVRKDKLRSDINEVGYGVTAGEIFDAKCYGFLDKDAELPKSLTKEEADKWMEEVTIPTYDALVRKRVKVSLTREQRFALISFAHNTGSGNLDKLVASKDRLNSGNFECVSKVMRLYVNAGKHTNVPGLVRRRSWEADLFGDYTIPSPTEIADVTPY